MKVKLLTGVLVLLMGLPLMAAPPQGKSAKKAAQNVDNTTYIAANKILMFVTNHGNFGRDLGGVFGNDYGTYFPFTTVNDINSGANVRSPYYAGGLWVGGRDSAAGDTVVCVSVYSSEYVPGPALGGTFQTDRPEFRVYKLYSDSLGANPNQDYLEWPYDQGAPRHYIYDVDTTSDPWDSTLVDSVPGIIGNEFCWAAYNDFDPDQHDDDVGSTAPVGIEVKQSTFAFTREDPLANVVFIRYQIYNVGDRTLEDCFFSIFSDPDLGGAGDDLVGTDTVLDLAFTYNATNSDQQYTSTPPSIGIDFFQGPLEYTGNIGIDSAKMWGTWWPGYVNKGLFSFNKYINGTDPDSYVETYQFMLGLDAKAGGTPYTNPTTGDVTTYVMSGDPVAGTGWLDDTPADRRHMQTTGPITFRPGDSTEILCALVVGRGGDRKSSISVMKYYDRFAQVAYELDFILPDPPAAPVVTVGELDGQLSLSWTDISEQEPGDFPFEGYTVYQGESSDGPWTRIANYDIINGEAQIQDEVLDPTTGALEIRAVKFGSDSGIRRYFVVDQDYLNGTALYNLSTYYFRVEAYSYDPEKTPRTLTSANRQPIELVPQAPPAGVDPQEDLLSDIDITHEGVSDGTVTVTVLDPMALTGHDYSVTFGYTAPDTTVTVHTDSTLDSTTFDTLTDTCWFEFVESVWTPILCVDTIDWWDTEGPLYDTAIDSTIFWRLNDVTLGTIVIDSQFNQSGDGDYLVTDGFICRVAGPEPGIASFAMISNASGELDPPAPGAAAFAGFPTPDGTDPVAGQQASGARWLITTGDDGGTAGGGTRGTYAKFLERTFRAAEDGGARLARLGSNDFEWRFTEDGGWAWDGFNTGEGYSVPFEIWQTGIGTPDDPSDDIRLIPWILGDVTGDGSGDNLEFDLSQYGSATSDPVTCHDGCEHSISGVDNDPYTDLVYWRIAPGAAPGDADYQTFATAMQTDPAGWGGAELPIIDRSTLCIWNGGVTPPFQADLPETGTTFRITTFKPNALADVFAFTAAAPREFANEDALNAIKAVPNPFYMFGPYDPAAGNYQIQFHHLPRVCSISIYNLAGDFISRIDKDGSDESGIASWNLQSDNRIPVASGIYIYVVDAPGFGQKIGKIAVFYEDEVLTIY